MGSPQITVGAVIEIDLKDGQYAYGRILAGADYGIYDFQASQRIASVEEVIHRPFLFIVAVYNEAINSRRWVKIGKAPLVPALPPHPLKFIQDALHPERFELYEPLTGTIIPALKHECKGLERCSAWAPEQVEARIRDHYAGRPNPTRERDLAVFD